MPVSVFYVISAKTLLINRKKYATIKAMSH